MLRNIAHTLMLWLIAALHSVAPRMGSPGGRAAVSHHPGSATPFRRPPRAFDDGVFRCPAKRSGAPGASRKKRDGLA
jgi:hypothetical protein